MRRLAPLLLLGACAGPLPAQDAPAAAPAPAAPAVAAAGDRLLVCNKAAHSLSVFDPQTRKEVATVPTGRGPHEVAVAPDGRTAVVSDYGDQKPGQTLTVVDVLAGAALRTIDLTRAEPAADGTRRSRAFLRPHGVQFVAPGKVVVTSESARCLLLVDVATGAIERTWSTPQATMHMVALAADLRTAAATSIKDGNVVFFALAGDGAAAHTPVACGEGSEGLAIDPRRGVVWVGNRAANTVSVVDPATAKVTRTLGTGDFPFRLAFARGGDLVLVTCAEGGQVQVFDAHTCALRREISIHADVSEQSSLPMGITADPEGRRAYVTCGRGEFVAVLDLDAGTVVDRWAGRQGCDGIAYARPQPAAKPR